MVMANVDCASPSLANDLHIDTVRPARASFAPWFDELVDLTLCGCPVAKAVDTQRLSPTTSESTTTTTTKSSMTTRKSSRLT